MRRASISIGFAGVRALATWGGGGFGVVKRFLGAVGADTVLGLAISTEDLPGRGVGATAECTLPVHGAGGVRPRQRERGLARGYEQVEPLAGWGGARRRNLQRLADLQLLRVIDVVSGYEVVRFG